MTQEEIKPYHDDVVALWKFMKEFLLRTDSETDPDRYWYDVVSRYKTITQGQSKFLHEICVKGIRELERVKRCTSAS